MKYALDKLENIYQTLKTDPKNGLTDQQVSGIQKEKGFNKFDEEKKDTILQKIFHHMKDFTSLILLAAGHRRRIKTVRGEKVRTFGRIRKTMTRICARVVGNK